MGKTTKKRSVVPDIDIDAIHDDERHNILASFQRDDPDFVYSWKSADKADARLLNRIGAELVREEDGEVAVYVDDVLVKTPKDIYMKRKLRGELASKKKVERHVFNEANDAPELKEMRKKLIERKRRPRKPPSVEEQDALQ